MWQLFKHDNNKFDIGFVKNGNLIVFSNQGYERKAGALKALKLVVAPKATYQDNTLKNPAVYIFHADTGKPVLTAFKPVKPYLP